MGSVVGAQGLDTVGRQSLGEMEISEQRLEQSEGVGPVGVGGAVF